MAPRNDREEFVRLTEKLIDKILTCTQVPLPAGMSADLEWQYFEEIHDLMVELIDTQEKLAKEFRKTLPKPKGSIADRLAKFKKWLIANGVDKDVPIDFKADLEEGIGAVATRKIKAGEEILKIPRSLMLTTLSAQRSVRIREFLNADRQRRNDLPMSVLLILHILEHKHDPTSNFKAYLDVLPESFPLPVFYAPSEMVALKGTTAVRDAAQRLREVLRGYALTYYAVEKSKLLSVWQYTFSEYRWAACVLYTRQNSIPGYSQAEAAEFKKMGVETERLPRQVLALIPGWDFINSKDGLEITSTNDFDEGAQVFTAPETVKEGQQIYMSYFTTRSNRDRFLCSGFISDEPVKGDFLPVPFKFVKSKNVEERRELLLNKYARQAPFPLNIQAPLLENHDNVIGTLVCAFGTAADLEFVGTLADCSDENTPMPERHAVLRDNLAKTAKAYSEGKIACVGKILQYIQTQAELYLARSDECAAVAAAELEKVQAELKASPKRRSDTRVQVRRNAALYALAEIKFAQSIIAYTESERAALN
ncbi:hypothetical protein BC828DRAFT_384788 [Blastocladiella britannica]|nr:hypothetical protein BC828DRAFT_384788 [Blastocladiella britannica]